VEEGSIVRCIVRLDETCRDVRNAARYIIDIIIIITLIIILIPLQVKTYHDNNVKCYDICVYSVIGDPKLYQNMVAASELIKR
jgi:superfamily II RNA helicase